MMENWQTLLSVLVGVLIIGAVVVFLAFRRVFDLFGSFMENQEQFNTRLQKMLDKHQQRLHCLSEDLQALQSQLAATSDQIQTDLKTRTEELSQQAATVEAQARTSLAIAHLNQENWKLAETTAQSALELNPQDTTARTVLLHSLNRQAHYEQAAQVLDPLLEYPDQLGEELLAEAGYTLRACQRVADAEALHRKALESAPNSPRLLNELGLDLLANQQYQQACDCFQQALEHAPDLPELLYNHGVTLIELGHDQSGLQALRHATDRCPQRVEWLYTLGLAFLKNGAHGPARAIFEWVVRLQPTFSRAWADHTTALRGIGDWEAATEAAEQATILDPSSAHAWTERGLVAIAVGELALAEEILTKACELDPQNPDPVTALAQLFALHKKNDQAAELYRQAVQLKQTSAEYKLKHAQSLAAQGDWDQTMKQLDHALREHPDNGDLYLVMARTCLEAGQVEKARDIINKSGPHLQSTSERLASAYLGVVAALRGGTSEQLQTAIERILRFIERRPEALPMTAIEPLEPLALYHCGFGADEVAYHDQLAQLLSGKLEIEDYHAATSQILASLTTQHPDGEPAS